jgi:uncharacterized protein
MVCIPIKLYQYLISPLITPCCRYYPSCSEYTEQAIKEHGVIQGLWMGSKRLLRCHPASQGGYDPVFPRARSKEKISNYINRE